MRVAPIVSLIVAFVLTGLMTGCRDENDPEFLLEQMHDRPWRESALKNIKEMFNTTMQENGNDLANPKIPNPDYMNETELRCKLKKSSKRSLLYKWRIL